MMVKDLGQLATTAIVLSSFVTVRWSAGVLKRLARWQLTRQFREERRSPLNKAIVVSVMISNPIHLALCNL